MRLLRLLFKQIRREPVMFQSLVQASLALLTGFGVFNVTENQMGLILAFTAALLAFITRSVVTPWPEGKVAKPKTPAKSSAPSSNYIGTD